MVYINATKKYNPIYKNKGKNAVFCGMAYHKTPCCQQPCCRYHTIYVYASPNQTLDVVLSVIHIISNLISLCKVEINLGTFHRLGKVTLTIFLSSECVIKTSGWSSDGWSHDPSVILGVAWQWPQSVWSDVCWHCYGCKLKQKSATKSGSWDTVTNTKYKAINAKTEVHSRYHDTYYVF